MHPLYHFLFAGVALVMILGIICEIKWRRRQ